MNALKRVWKRHWPLIIVLCSVLPVLLWWLGFSHTAVGVGFFVGGMAVERHRGRVSIRS